MRDGCPVRPPARDPVLSPRSNAAAVSAAVSARSRPRRSAALLVASGAMLALPIALRRVIDVLAAKDAGTTNLIFAGFLAAAAIFAVFAALRFYLVTWLGERVVADLRSAVYSRVVRLDPLFFETTRVGEVLSRLTTDTTLVQAISGVNLSIILRSTLSLIGALVLLTLTSAKLAGRHPRADSGRGRAADHHRTPRARIVARIAGPHRRHQRSRRRNLECDPDRPGLHPGELQSERYRKAVEDSFDAAVRRTRVRAALTGLGITAGVRRHHVRALARRASSARGNHDRRAARPVPAVCGIRRHFRRGALRDVGRAAARRGRHGAARGAARGPSRHHGAAANPLELPPRIRGAIRFDNVDLPLSIAARDGRRSRISAWK